MIFGQLLSLVLGFSLLAAFGITTDQIMQNVYDSTNTALRTNLVAGGGGGGSGTVSAGTINTLSKYTAATTVGNSAITDDGSGAIGIYPASATPQAVTETFASGNGANIAGAATTIKLSGSTGSGVGGTLAIQNTNLAGTGSTANTYGNVLTLSPPNTGTTAPVNYLDIKNAITTGAPTITATGTDSAINVAVTPKGTGSLFVTTSGSLSVPALSIGSSSMGFFNVAGAALGITFGTNQNFMTFSANDPGLRLTSTGMLGFANTTTNTAGVAQDAFFMRSAAASIQMGKNSNTPITQTFKAFDAVSGVSDGSDLVLTGGSKSTTGQDGAVVLGKGYAIANLPTGRPEGARAWVTDQITACPATGAAPTAGGAIRCPVFFNGTSWVGG